MKCTYRGLLAAIVLMLTACANLHWSHFYPYCAINPNYLDKHLPADFESCLSIIDTVLSKEAKQYFKKQDSNIAVIEICSPGNGIASLFSFRWGLDMLLKSDYAAENNNSYYTLRQPADVIYAFEKKGIRDPAAMERVLFSCYYKKLNNISYDWESEIQKIKSYWKNPAYGEGYLSHEISKRENGTLNEYRFNQLNVSDTVDVLYNGPPRLIKKTPDWYYLTGIIQFKVPEKRLLNIKLIDIKPEFGEKYYLEADDTVRIGDTATFHAKGWLKRGLYYFNYSRNREYRDNL